MSNRPTYPELLKLFYKHSFPDQLGAPASSVAQAIIYKANDLYFPSEFKMSNVELSHLSGEDVSNIGRTRQKVLDICKIDRVPLFTYVGNEKRKAGKYIINYSLTSSWRQDSVNEASNSRQKDPLIDNDPNSTLLNETKHPPAPLNDVTTLKGPPDSENGGDGIFSNGEKTEEEFEKIKNELRYHQVNEPSRSQLAREYDTRYIERQILQVDKDFLKPGNKFNDAGAILVARIKSNYPTPDYPE